MPRPVGRRELVADQPVDGRGVGNAQQRLGEAKQRDAFLRGEAVFAQEHVDAAAAVAALARLGDEAARRRRRSACFSGGASSAAARMRATASASSVR